MSAAEVGEDDPYTDAPAHVRLSSNGPDWSIDGVNNDLLYTESVWTFDTFEQAVAAIPEFVKHTGEHGVRWDWDAQRPHDSRHISPLSAAQHRCNER